VVWYKAWVESRLRFLAAAAVMAAVCGAAVLGHDAIQSVLANRPAPPATYAAYVHRVSYGGLTRVLFMTFAMVLGVGGLLRERELGTSAFTLALPVARTRLVLVRAAAGLLEIAAIALIQGLAIVTLSPLVHQIYPPSQALEYALLWSAGGAALFAVAFLASAVCSGEYTAFIVAQIALLVHTVSTQFVRIARPATWPYLATLQEIMSGLHMSYLDPKQSLLIGPLPLVPVAIVTLLTAALIACAVAVTIRQDF